MSEIFLWPGQGIDVWLYGSLQLRAQQRRDTGLSELILEQKVYKQICKQLYPTLTRAAEKPWEHGNSYFTCLSSLF